MGTFLTKEQLESEAERLGVDLTGATWAQKQHLIAEAKKKAGESIQYGATAEKPKAKKQEEQTARKVRTIRKQVQEESQLSGFLRDLRNKTLFLAPEIAPTAVQLYKYDEEVGEELEVEEVHYNGTTLDSRRENLATGTYEITGRTGRKVIAQSTFPKENAQITWDVYKELVPVVEFGGRKGYLYTHHSLPNIRALLDQSGYFEEYKDRFTDGRGGVFYLTGLLCCDIAMTNQTFSEIERKAKERKARYGA